MCNIVYHYHVHMYQIYALCVYVCVCTRDDDDAVAGLRKWCVSYVCVCAETLWGAFLCPHTRTRRSDIVQYEVMHVHTRNGRRTRAYIIYANGIYAIGAHTRTHTLFYIARHFICMICHPPSSTFPDHMSACLTRQFIELYFCSLFDSINARICTVFTVKSVR